MPLTVAPSTLYLDYVQLRTLDEYLPPTKHNHKSLFNPKKPNYCYNTMYYRLHNLEQLYQQKFYCTKKNIEENKYFIIRKLCCQTIKHFKLAI